MGGLALAALLVAASPCTGDDRGGPVPSGATRNEKAFKKPSGLPLDFRGPGREQPEPDVSEVVLGWFGPGDPAHPEFGDFWRGAVLALEAENAAGGYRGRPFRLQAVWSESPWRAGIVDLTRLVVAPGVLAVIGGIDGTTTHLAAQVALKSHLLLLSPGSTDATADHANVPWLFSLPLSDERIAPALAGALSKAAGRAPFAVAAATDHDSHAALVALRRSLGALGLGPAALVEFAVEQPDWAGLAARLLSGRPAALVILAPSRAGGRLVAALRGTGFVGPIVGGAPAARAAFRRAAGPAAQGVLAPLPVGPRPAWEPFARVYEARWKEPPDDAGARGYDAVRLVAQAVRRGGLNRPLVRDAVRGLAPWTGASGTVSWNAKGRNDADAVFGSWRDGRLVVSCRP